MARRRCPVEQIISELRQAEVELSKGSSTSAVCKKLGITENTYYRWRREFGGLRVRGVVPREAVGKLRVRGTHRVVRGRHPVGGDVPALVAVLHQGRAAAVVLAP